MTTREQQAARRVSYQLDTLWDYDYEPTHQELDTLYETAKKNQWNGSTAIDWSRPIGSEGPVLNVQVAFGGTNFFSRLTEEQQKEVEIRVSAWRLSQFLHGEQGALVVCGQLVNSIPELDAKLYASTQVVDEGRHVNFGYFALRRSIPDMEAAKREYLEDFSFKVCDLLYARDERTGFRSIQDVWNEMGWDGEKIWRETVKTSQTTKAFNSFLFQENLMPRLVRLGLISERIAPRYREIGLMA